MNREKVMALMEVFSNTVRDLKELNLIVDSKFELDGDKLLLVIKADNEPRQGGVS